MTDRGSSWWQVGRWTVWSLPGPLLIYVLAVEAVALSVVAIDGLVWIPLEFAPAAVGSGLLVAGGVAHAEVSLRVERVRRRIGLESAQIDLTSVWTFVAALVMPPVVATAVVVALYTYLYVRVWRPVKTLLYRHVFSAVTHVLAVNAAGWLSYVLDGRSDGGAIDDGRLFVVVAAMLVFTTINTGLVLTAAALSANKPVRELLGGGDEVMLETAVLCLGALVAIVWLVFGPWVVMPALLAIVALHRAALVRTLREAADIDRGTGVLSAAAWQLRAERTIAAARTRRRSVVVLAIDLDHFKRIIDTHGHHVRDAVIRAVAARIRDEMDDRDLIGRFGDDEFLVLLAGRAATHARSEMERAADFVRSSIATMDVAIATADGPLTIDGLTASIGVARFPDSGADVAALVAAADAALAEAKHAGRNTFRIAPPRAVAAVPPTALG